MDRATLEEHDRLEEHHWWFLARRRIIIERLCRLVPPDKRTLVVEIGCATGGNLKELVKHYRVLGIEPDAAAAGRAEVKSGAEVLIGALPAAAAMVPPDASAILCLDVLEHVEDDVAALRGLHEHMSRGAVLLVTVPAIPSLFGAHDKALGHYRRYSRSELAAKLTAGGFPATVISHFNALLLPPAWLWRKIRGDRGKGTDLVVLPTPLNGLLAAVFGMERFLMRICSLPIGLSLLAEAVRD